MSNLRRSYKRVDVSSGFRLALMIWATFCISGKVCIRLSLPFWVMAICLPRRSVVPLVCSKSHWLGTALRVTCVSSDKKLGRAFKVT